MLACMFSLLFYKHGKQHVQYRAILSYLGTLLKQESNSKESYKGLFYLLNKIIVSTDLSKVLSLFTF